LINIQNAGAPVRGVLDRAISAHVVIVGLSLKSSTETELFEQLPDVILLCGYAHSQADWADRRFLGAGNQLDGAYAVCARTCQLRRDRSLPYLHARRATPRPAIPIVWRKSNYVAQNWLAFALNRSVAVVTWSR
jgi:hypothetical protein